MNFMSERLKYRFFTNKDFPLFYSIFSNEQVMRYAWIDKFDSENDTVPFFENFINSDGMVNNNNAYAFAVFTRQEDTFVGFADIEIHSRNSSGGVGEIGYFLLPAFWGKGYATEIANSLIDAGFMSFGFHKITARCNANNLKSEAIMIKAGMTKEGVLRKVRFKYGKWDDEKHYGILREEWDANNITK